MPPSNLLIEHWQTIDGRGDGGGRLPSCLCRRGKGLKFINSTHVVGLLGSAVQPPYPDYRLFIWNLDRPSEVHLYKVFIFLSAYHTHFLSAYR